MSIELTAKIKAIDEASEKIKKIGDEAEKSMNRVKDSAEKAEFSMKKFATSISGLMTSCFSLYNAYDRIQDAQLAVTKAQNTLAQAQISAKNAQEAYNLAVEKYGADSEQARDALEKLQLAQDRVSAAQESLKDKQDRVNEAIVQMAIQSIPAAITAFTNLKGVVDELSNAFDAAKVSVASFDASLTTILGAIGIISASAAYAAKSFQEDMDNMERISQDASKGMISDWDQFMMRLQMIHPLLDNIVSDMKSAFDWLSNIISNAISGSMKNLDSIKEGFKDTSDEIVGGSIWPDMWEEITETTKEGLSNNIDEIDRAMREIRRRLSRPFYVEVILTVNAQSIRSQVQSIINEVLKSVVIEKTSSQATTSRIRVPVQTTPAPATASRAREVMM
jgi:hypothetical protein